MDEKVFFHLSYETMLGDTEDFINACLERANRADCNDADAEIARARSAIELWYHLRWRAVPRKTSPTGTICASPECSCALPQQNNVHGSSNNLPQAVAAAATGTDCAGRPRCETSGAGGDAGYRAGAGAGRGRPVYGPNLRASCRRMEAAGWLRTLRAPNLQLAVELTEAGRGIAEPLFQAEREAETARQRLTDVRRLPLRQTAAGDAVELQLGDGHYTIREAAYVIRLDGTTCLQLTDAGGIRRIKEGDPLQVASWYQACFDAGLPVIVQVNESRD